MSSFVLSGGAIGRKSLIKSIKLDKLLQSTFQTRTMFFSSTTILPAQALLLRITLVLHYEPCLIPPSTVQPTMQWKEDWAIHIFVYRGTCIKSKSSVTNALFWKINDDAERKKPQLLHSNAKKPRTIFLIGKIFYYGKKY